MNINYSERIKKIMSCESKRKLLELLLTLEDCRLRLSTKEMRVLRTDFAHLEWVKQLEGSNEFWLNKELIQQNMEWYRDAMERKAQDDEVSRISTLF